MLQECYGTNTRAKYVPFDARLSKAFCTLQKGILTNDLISNFIKDPFGRFDTGPYVLYRLCELIFLRTEYCRGHF